MSANASNWRFEYGSWIWFDMGNRGDTMVVALRFCEKHFTRGWSPGSYYEWFWDTTGGVYRIGFRSKYDAEEFEHELPLLILQS
jgi:hypothetical protein